MKQIPLLLFLYFLLQAGCKPQEKAPVSCMENPGVEGKMLVIVGEKISMEEIPQEEGSMYGKFLATYKINELVCGNYKRDTISFFAYDHYGDPGFSKFKNAMLFLSDYDSVIYQQLYQFFDVYKTKDGRWASSYQPEDYGRTNSVKPDSVEFVEEVSYNIIGGKKKLIKEYYPEPYFKITKEKAIAVWGNYLPELLQLKKEGVLKARGLFGPPHPAFETIETEMAEINNIEYLKLSQKEEAILKNTFSTFINAVKTKNTQQLKEMSLDSIYCSLCEGIRNDYYDNELDAINVFIDSSFEHLTNTEIWGPKDSRYKLKINATIQNTKPLNFSVPANEKFVIYSIFFFDVEGKSHKYVMPKSHVFKFVKVNGIYKFYGMTSY